MWTLILALLTLSPAHATEVWSYRLEPKGHVSGGKLKLSELERAENYRKIKFRYKLETSVGHREGWLPYNVPDECYDGAWLSKLTVGKDVALGQYPHGWEEGRVLNYSIRRIAGNQFQLTNEDAKIIFRRDSTGVWARVEAQLSVSGVTLQLNGNLSEITEE